MTQQLIGVGTVANDGTGDPLRTAFQKTNANFTDLYNGNAGILAKTGTASSSLTGTLTETIFATIPISASLIGANGWLRITGQGTCSNSANTKSVRCRVGTTGITSTQFAGTAGQTTNTNFTFTIYINAVNATNAQYSTCVSDRGSDHLMSNAAQTTTTVDMTSTQNLYLTGILTNIADSVQLQSYLVEYMS